MPYLKRINSLPLINHISYKYAQVSDIGPSWSSCQRIAFGGIHVSQTELVKVAKREIDKLYGVFNFISALLSSEPSLNLF